MIIDDLENYLSNYSEIIFKDCKSNINKSTSRLYKIMIDGDEADNEKLDELKYKIKDLIKSKKSNLDSIFSQIKILFSALENEDVFENGAIRDLNDSMLLQRNALEDFAIYKQEHILKTREDIHYRLYSLARIENLLDNFIDDLTTVIDKHRNSLLLSELFRESKKAIIVGNNGSGKSTLVEDLKKDKMKRTLILPARKNLIFYDDYHNINKPDDLYHENQQLKLKESRIEEYKDNKSLHYFTNLIRTIVSEEHDALSNCRLSVIEKINKTFQKLFPEFKFLTDAYEHKINVYKNESQPYEINNLSDGEKSIFFYIASIILAPENSIIVVDEPETHLHPSICSKLWDELLLLRDNCYFIFVSHDINFISSRNDSTISWCKNYIDSFKNEILTNINDENISREILISLLGSTRPILFCEGNLESYDYKLYSLLYSDNYTIKPVGNHLKVIEYTKHMNDLDFNIGNHSAIGIVDRDYKTDDEIQKLRDERIFVLPVNEIEMLFMYKEIIEKVIEWRENCTEFLIKIEEDINKTLISEKNLDKMSAEFCNYQFAKLIELNKAKDKNTLLKNVNTLIENVKKIDNMFEKRKEVLTKIFNSDDWENKLRYCSLKKEITRALMDKKEHEYINRAISQIRNNTELKEFLKNKINIPT